MNNNTILPIAFLIAGTLLASAVITMVPAAYAGGDDGNKLKAEDESAGAIADCDDNEVERAGFTCVPIAAADIEADLSGVLGLASELSAEEPEP